MLSSTARNLYWMGRYLQRAESTARLLLATQRMALQSGADEAGTAASIYGLRDQFFARFPDGGLEHFIDFMALDESNPASLLASIKAARDNARAERNNLTADVWESLNGLWLEMSGQAAEDRQGLDRGTFIDSVNKQTVMIVGAAQATLLRDDAYNFLLLGTFLERADNTARILDVKFHRLRPDGGPQPIDAAAYYEWSEVLASIGALRTYRRVYRARLEPFRVVELMLLRRDLPRSVHHCLWQADLNMRELAERYGGKGEADRLCGELHARLRYCRTDQIFAGGLHAFLMRLGGDLRQLSAEIGRQFLLE